MITFELLSPGKYLPAHWWCELAPETTGVEVEIGPGDGGFLVAIARLNPQTLYLGLEIRRGLSERLLLVSPRLANVHALQADASWVVTHLFADASVVAYHVYFPDPWWKKRHHKRRMFRPALVRHLYRTLEAGGSVFVVTDVGPLFCEIRALLEAAGFEHRVWSRDAADSAHSSYERKYRRQERTIESARFLKPR